MEKTDKIVGYWLMTGAFLVIAMVILGGYTRLSHSGLSMVTWKPVTGIFPPTTEQQWEAEFEQYKTSPEYLKHNYHFTVEEFKSIYWPEFLHRLLGRVLGIVFLIPFFYFLLTGKLKNKRLRFHLLIIFLLGGLQGFIGWYMVKSGLVDIPSVSHYRLAIHFITALTLFSYILWVSLGILYPKKVDNPIPKIQNLLVVLLCFTVVQLIYGAFVAGLKAGLFFPTFPKMGTEWVPQSLGMALDTYGLKSLVEFPALVQFIHRWLAAVIVLLTVKLFIKGKKCDLTIEQRNGLVFILIAVSIQFLLGVFTILYAVPISLGVLHQLGSVVLLSSIIIALYQFKTFNKGA